MAGQFRRLVTWILVGIAVVVGVTCVLAGWGSAAEIGFACILGGAVAITLGAALGPSQGRAGYQRSNPFLVDRMSELHQDDALRAMKKQDPGLWAWLAAGAIAILVGILLRVI